MRPPHCAGEIDCNLSAIWPINPCFNEAPALRGGNRRNIAIHGFTIQASMRPPHCAGEIDAYVRWVSGMPELQ